MGVSILDPTTEFARHYAMMRGRAIEYREPTGYKKRSSTMDFMDAVLDAISNVITISAEDMLCKSTFCSVTNVTLAERRRYIEFFVDGGFLYVRFRRLKLNRLEMCAEIDAVLPISLTSETLFTDVADFCRAAWEEAAACT
jgi:hypothetical protein